MVEVLAFGVLILGTRTPDTNTEVNIQKSVDQCVTRLRTRIPLTKLQKSTEKCLAGFNHIFQTLLRIIVIKLSFVIDPLG